ncbi:tripartite motif-containing protein 2-like [Branchiostoma lanceolatum]|uniref:tripartite motif-containing protein 2-like n=1 Tax=Branchiostoma lanceolatum TaxID=7740 RepID=UPI0034542BBE
MAAAPLTLGEQIREELTCSICLELFTKPKMLPCQHTFCQDCLKDIAGDKECFQCPNCRRRVKLPRKGVAGLRDSHLVMSLCQRLQNQATLSQETTEKSQSENKCDLHPSQKFSLYCKQCSTPVCNECLDEMHSDHVTITLKKAAQERTAPVEALVDEVSNIAVSYSSLLSSYRETIKSLELQHFQTRNSIIQAYEEMVQKLTDNKDNLLSKCDIYFAKNGEAICKEGVSLMVHQPVHELSVTYQRALLALKQGGIELLSQETILTDLVRKYRGKPAPTPVQTQPAVFQPADTPVPVLGHVTSQSLPAAPTCGDVVEEDIVHETIIFGRVGSGRGQFKGPSGVTVSDEGEIFVADFENQRIQVFTLQKTFVRQFRTVVSRSYSFFLFLSGEVKMNPGDVAVDGQGNLWVVGSTDSDDEFAVQYNKQGKVLRKIDLQKTGWLRGIAVDTRKNHILITQTIEYENITQAEVLVFNLEGTLVRTVGRQQGMENPHYVTLNGKGNILVSDFGNHCVFVYSEDGDFLFQFGSEGSGEGQLQDPRGICTDRAGNIIIADSGNNRVELFSKTGKFLRHIASDMEDPFAVAMAPQGNLVVTESQLSNPV